MDLHNYLANIGLTSIESKIFRYKIDNYESTISYEEYHKKYKDSEIGIYYLFDISCLEENSLKIINDYDEFVKFQEYFISKTFFGLKDFLRYNLYIILILPDKKYNVIDSETKLKIEWNFEYSRKIFLKDSEIEKYFNYFNKLDKFKPTKKYDILKYRTIKQCISILNDYGMKSALITRLNDENREDLHQYIFNFELNTDLKYDSIKKNNITAAKFFDKYFKNEVDTNFKKYEFEHIDKIKNISFRKNILKSDEIKLKKFNLLCGENASGKTSLLELIEYTLTGKINKTNQDKEKGESKLYSTNGNVFSSDLSYKTSIAIKNTWYKNKIGNLNKLFCRINYFDIDAAYNFAIEYGKNSYQDFFCDYQLLFMKENINEHIKVFKSTEKSLDAIMQLFNDYPYERKKYFYKKSIFKRIKNYFLSYRNRKLLKKNTISNIDLFIEKYNKSKKYINKYIEILNECVNKIDKVLEEEIQVYIDYINIIYWILFSKDQMIDYNKELQSLTLSKDVINHESTDLDNISTAQRVCVALSVIFTQFFSATDAPKFILLDETVANFDSIHLLNLLDFLRELTINNIQIVFTTADDNTKNLTKNKFSFLGDDFKIITINNENNKIN